MEKFTVKQFFNHYTSDDVCLQEIFENRYGHLEDFDKYYKVTGRKCYAHSETGEQLHPLSGTIFHKSSTSLINWFYVMFLFGNSKNGVSAKEVERQLGVTYKTAWRMCKQIRILFNKQAQGSLGGVVEVDETYHGGVYPRKSGKQKHPVVGMVERGGGIRVKATQSSKARHVVPLVQQNVRVGSTVMTDGHGAYNFLNGNKYQHRTVNHSKSYVLDDAHTNTIEGFWSQLKRSIHGTYHSVSPKYLQSYLDEFAYRYNLRDHRSLFPIILQQAVKPVEQVV